MSSLERVLSRVFTDQDFRTKVFENPEQVAEEYGLGVEDVAALRVLSSRTWSTVSPYEDPTGGGVPRRF